MAKRSSGTWVLLAGVSVRPVRDAAEQAEWDRLMDARHDSGFKGLFGGGLRHVAETPDGRGLALVGWFSGAVKVKVRDVWVRWAPELQFRRLRLIANNTRFSILSGVRIGPPPPPRGCLACRRTWQRCMGIRCS